MILQQAGHEALAALMVEFHWVNRTTKLSDVNPGVCSVRAACVLLARFRVIFRDLRVICRSVDY